MVLSESYGYRGLKIREYKTEMRYFYTNFAEFLPNIS